MLSVQVPAEASVQLLEGYTASRMARLLESIPVEVSLGNPAAASLIDADGPADGVGRSYDGLHGIGWVSAGKLLARKRPHLVPVYDQVVKCALGAPTHWWMQMHEAMGDERLRSRIHAVRVEAEVPSHVSDLRVVDVVVWMAHHDAHGAGCPPTESTMTSTDDESALDRVRAAGGGELAQFVDTLLSERLRVRPCPDWTDRPGRASERRTPARDCGPASRVTPDQAPRCSPSSSRRMRQFPINGERSSRPKTATR